jgi:hypothetical protein
MVDRSGIDVGGKGLARGKKESNRIEDRQMN